VIISVQYRHSLHSISALMKSAMKVHIQLFKYWN